jgi:hypothetical protein
MAPLEASGDIFPDSYLVVAKIRSLDYRFKIIGVYYTSYYRTARVIRCIFMLLSIARQNKEQLDLDKDYYCSSKRILLESGGVRCSWVSIG